MLVGGFCCSISVVGCALTWSFDLVITCYLGFGWFGQLSGVFACGLGCLFAYCCFI